MKNYSEVIEYLFAQLPMFTRDGITAIDFEHDKTQLLCSALENPQNKFKSIHIAGTNGKGSSSHMLASVLRASGLKTGLYTSPHLVDFRERIRINGAVIPEINVVDFFQQNRALIESIKPSFFELTVALAFDYFAKEKVDIAIIEVGLGGRLDSTNIIQPELCLISNIGLDHMNILGDTLIEIAAEKAGIFKQGVPIVVSEKQSELVELFVEKANQKDAELIFATDRYLIKGVESKIDGLHVLVSNLHSQVDFSIISDLSGSYQLKNILGVLTCFDKLRELGYNISHDQIKFGLAHVQRETGLRGRWETLANNPWIICDTGHNEDGIKTVLENLGNLKYNRLHFLFGAMRDKDLSHIMPLLPKEGLFYFVAPNMPRALPSIELNELASSFGLTGHSYQNVSAGFNAAKDEYMPGDLIFVGGSTFVVAELLTNHF